MPVPVKDTEIAYTGDGAAVAFPFDFKVFQASHFKATIDDVISVDYVLTGLGSSLGGVCTFNTAPPNLSRVVVSRVVPYGRTDFDYITNGEFRAETVDEDFDTEAMQSQQLATNLKRVPRVRPGDLTMSLDLVPEANTLLAWNGAETGIVNVDPVTVTPSTVIMTTLGQQVVTTLTKPALMALIGSQSHGLANASLAFSAAGNALTLALKGHDGNDLSADSRAFVAFRSATAASGDVDIVEISAALSLTINSGAALGVLNNNQPFRIWVVLFNDAGAVSLGVIRPLSYDASVLYSNPIPALLRLRSAGGIASASAMGAGSDSSQTFYADVGHTAVPYAVLGYFEYSSGLAAIGLWASVPTGAAVWTPGMPLPGDVVSSRRYNEGEMITDAIALPFDDTIPTNAEGNLFLSLSMTSNSRPNLHHIRGAMNLASSGTPASVAATLCEATITNALAVVSTGRDGTAGAQCQAVIDFSWVPTMAVPAYRLRAGNSAGTITLNGSGGVRQFGGVMVSFIEIEEVMV